MWVLLRWLFRTMRANILRTASTVAGIAASFMLLTFAVLVVNSCVVSIGSDGRGILLFLVYCIAALILITPGYWLYISVTMEERKRQYHVLFSTGANNWQMLKCIAVEVFLVVMTGAVPGAAIGTALAWAGLRGLQSVEGIRFCWDTRAMLRVTMIESMLVILSMVGYAAYILYRGEWKREALFSRQPVYRHALLRRILGIGAVLGDATCKKDEKHYTACMPALVASVCALLLVVSLFTIMKTITPYEALTAVKMSYTMDDAGDADVMRTLCDMQAAGEIEAPITCRSYHPNVYCLLPESGMSDAFVRERGQWSFLRSDTLGGNSCHECRTTAEHKTVRQEMLFPQILFYDDASFMQLCAQNGVSDPQTAQALLYNVGQVRGRRVSLLESAPQEALTLVFYERVPSWEQGASVTEDGEDKPGGNSLLGRFDADEFLHSVRPARQMTIRVDGLLSDVSMDMQSLPEESGQLQPQKWILQSVPIGAKWGVPALIMPERLRGEFAFLHNAETSVFLNPGTAATFDKAGEEIPLTQFLIEKLSAQYPVLETVLSVGTISHGKRTNRLPIYVTDYIRASIGMDSLTRFLKTTAIRVVLVLFMFMLTVNIANIAHLNRIVRKREYALLEIIGIRQGQKVVMLLYESLLYSVRSVLYSIPISLLGLLGIYLLFAGVISEEKAAMLPTVTSFFGAGVLSDSAKALLDTFRLCLPQMLEYAMYAFVILFLAHLMTNIYLDLQMQRRTMLPVLKETPYK